MRILLTLDNGGAVALLDRSDLDLFGAPVPPLEGHDYRAAVAEMVRAAKASVLQLVAADQAASAVPVKIG